MTASNPVAIYRLTLRCALLVVCCSGARAAVFNIPNGDVAALKNAITIANSNGQADTINLAAGGLYTLTTVDHGAGSDPNGLPMVASDVGIAINGNGATIQRDLSAGTPDFRILIAAGSITISDLIIAYGRSPNEGGGFFGVGGQATLVRCALINNNGDNGGGACEQDGNIALANCLLANNSATERGGGFFVFGQGSIASAQLSNCTLSGNASHFGAGLYALAFLREVNVTISSCTFSNNLGNDTIVLGGDSHNAALLAVGNTILQAGDSDRVLGGEATVTSNGYNLSSDRAGGDLGTGPGGWLDGPGDIRNTNPQIGPLQNNGGFTLTHIPKPGSPVIDKGKRDAVATLPVTTDQRGFARPFDDPAIAPAAGGDNSDIGACEMQFAYQTGPVFTVNKMADYDDAACSTLDCTLREAISAANNTPGSPIIRFAPGIIGVIQLGSVLPNLIGNISIEGPGANLLSVRRNSADEFRIFTISNGTTFGPTVGISGLTITNGQVPFNSAGGGILNDQGNVTLSNCIITGNSATRGGGICSDIADGTASVIINNSTLSNNTAPGGFGGALFNAGGNTGTGNGISTLTNCTFSGNSASGGFGGAVYNAGSNGGAGFLSLVNCTLSDNAAANGGGIYNFNFGGQAAAGLLNTIFKTGSSGVSIANSGGSIMSHGHNLSNDNGGGFLTGSGDQLSTNPQLGPLQNNGGHTPTHALLANSPAINTGDNTFAPVTDQRGYGRNGATDKGAFELNGTPPANELLGAVSRKAHGSAGTFDINLPVVGAAGVECRSGGTNNDHQIVLSFAGAVTFSNASITSGTGSVLSSTGGGSNTIIVNLTGIANAQRITITLSGVGNGSSTTDVTVPIGILLGDTTGNGNVTGTDVSQAKLQSGQAVSGSNFRNDVNVSGSINGTDVSSVKLKSGTALP